MHSKRSYLKFPHEISAYGELKGWESDPIARFAQTRSNINRKIKDALDESQATHYQIQSWNPSSNQDEICYGLALSKDRIQF